MSVAKEGILLTEHDVEIHHMQHPRKLEGT